MSNELKLEINGTEYELEPVGVGSNIVTPFLIYNGQNYIGKAIPKQASKIPVMPVKDYEIIEKSRNAYEGSHGLIGTSEWIIKSVRRISDNEVFTVGEESFTKKTSSFIIAGFTEYKIDNLIHVWQKEPPYHLRGMPLCGLNDLIKLKQPVKLFTTEDNKPIYENDRAWFVNAYFSIDYYDFIDNGGENDLTHYPDRFKYFSIEAAAKDFIELNKPIFSLKEISDSYIGDKAFDNFIKFTGLSKSKLNQ